MGRKRYGQILAASMVITLMFGVLWLLVGLGMRNYLGPLIYDITEELQEEVHLESSSNRQDQNICPVLTSEDSAVNMGNWSTTIGSTFILAGALVIVFSLIGIFAGLVSSKPLLELVILALCVFIAFQIYIIYIGTDIYKDFHENIRDELLSKVSTDYTVEYEANTFTPALNSIMLWFQCCGIESFKDFGNLTFVEKVSITKTREYEFLVPPSCCRRALFNGYPGLVSYLTLKQCAIDGYKTTAFINQEGCYEVVCETVLGKDGVKLTIYHSVIITWNIIQLILAVVVILTWKSPPSPRPSEVLGRSDEDEIAEEKKPKPKLFIPFFKISSFQHPDANRIKSTEIW